MISIFRQRQGKMNRSVFQVRKMDCPSEENIIRMKLDGISEIRSLQFDIPQRRVTVIHEGNLPEIAKKIDSLKFDSSLVSSEVVSTNPLDSTEDNKTQSSLLWKVLTINFTLFVIEMTTGVISKSMGLVADSLDMLADAMVYGLSLLAIGGTITRKKSITRTSGYLQLFLAAIGLIEVARRFLGYEQMPDFQLMIIISLVALVANAACLYLLQKSKSKEAHMKATMIFTSNDIIINIGVIVAGILVFILESKLPDLIIGTIVFVIVTRGAFSILRLAK